MINQNFDEPYTQLGTHPRKRHRHLLLALQHWVVFLVNNFLLAALLLKRTLDIIGYIFVSEHYHHPQRHYNHLLQHFVSVGLAPLSNEPTLSVSAQHPPRVRVD